MSNDTDASRELCWHCGVEWRQEVGILCKDCHDDAAARLEAILGVGRPWADVKAEPSPAPATAEGSWVVTDYGFTDGVHQHHCMVTPDSETCAYLNARPSEKDAGEAERLVQFLIDDREKSGVDECEDCGIDTVYLKRILNALSGQAGGTP